MALPTVVPTMPSGYGWVQGGPALLRAGLAPVFAKETDTVWVWDATTGARITDLRDQFGQPVTEIPVQDGWFPGVGVPAAVALPAFSVGPAGQRIPGIPVQALRDASLSLAPTDTQVAALLSNPSSSARVQADSLWAPQSVVPDVVANTAGVAEVKAWKNLDISAIEPEFVNRLELKLANVMQGIGRDPVTGDWYASQSTTVGAAAGEDSVIISHMTPSGRFLDSMELVNAGHGSTFVVQNVGTDVYIWITWAWGASAGTGPRHELLRFKYRAGATLTRDETAWITTLSKWDGAGGGYTLMGADWANDRIALRVNPTGAETFTLRKISDMLAGTNAPLATIGPLSTAGATFQAFTTVGGSLYVYRGASGGEAHTVSEYSWTTGALVRSRVVTSLGNGISATPSDTYNEPEGMTAFADPFTGRSTLYIGKTRGASPPAINRKAFIFGYAPLGSSKGHGMRLLALEDGGDTGWQTLTLASGYKAFSAGTTPAYRVINGRVQFRGLVSPTTGNFTAGAGATVWTVPTSIFTGSPVSMRPEIDTFCAAGTSGGASGVMSVSAATGALIATPATAASWISLGNTGWLLG